MSGIAQPNVSVHAKPSVALELWLQYDKPITEKLKTLSGDAELYLLSQAWVPSTLWDADMLHIQDTMLQREIFMKSYNKIFWYARTVISLSCYTLDPDFFNRLKHESIRVLIFDEPKVSLKQRIIYPINDQSIEFSWVKKYFSTAQGILWVRLAEFSFLDQDSFYLIEVLFPELQELG